MINDIADLVDRYSKWLRDRTSLRQVGDIVEITTPYVDRHNDFIQIYARRENGGYILSDDSQTIGDLRMSGCDLDTPKRKSLLSTTVAGLGVQLQDDALIVRATSESFSHRKHNLLQAMLAVNDLFVLAAPTVVSLFREDVEAFLSLSDVRFTPSVKFTGKSGFDHHFDFVIPASRQRPERILRAMSKPSREKAESMIFAWSDTREVRPADAVAYAVLNDSQSPPSADVLSALRSYEIRPVLWSERDRRREEWVN